MTSNHSIIFKIASREAWATAEEAGRFDGAPIDLADGYIHFSTADQMKETAAKHFAGQNDLVLIAFETHSFAEALKWEPSRGGALFPHVYASIDPNDALWVKELPLGPDGKHVFPAVDL